MPQYQYEDRFAGGGYVGSQLEVPTSAVLREQFAQSYEENPIMAVQRMVELSVAKRRGNPLTKDQALERLAQNGLQGTLQIDDNGITDEALSTLMSRKRVELRRAEVFSRARGGAAEWGGRLGVALLTTMADPVNVGLAYLPIYGSARYATALKAAKGTLPRLAVRAKVGAIEGAVGAATVEPLIYAMRSQEQADYDAVDSLMNVSFGAMFGATLHTGVGTVADRLSAGAQAKRIRGIEMRIAERARLMSEREPPREPQVGEGFDAQQLVDEILEKPGEREAVDKIYQENMQKLREELKDSALVSVPEHVEKTREAVGQAVLDQPIDVTPPETRGVTRRTFLQGAGAAVASTILPTSRVSSMAPAALPASMAEASLGDVARLFLKTRSAIFRVLVGGEPIENVRRSSLVSRLLDMAKQENRKDILEDVRWKAEGPETPRTEMEDFIDRLSDDEAARILGISKDYTPEDIAAVVDELKEDVYQLLSNLDDTEFLSEVYSENLTSHAFSLDNVLKTLGREPVFEGARALEVRRHYADYLESQPPEMLKKLTKGIRERFYERYKAHGGPKETLDAIKKLARALSKKSADPSAYIDFHTRLSFASDEDAFREGFQFLEYSENLSREFGRVLQLPETQPAARPELPQQLTREPWVEGKAQPDPEARPGELVLEETKKEVPEDPKEGIDDDLAVAEAELKEVEQRVAPDEKEPDPELLEVEEAGKTAERWAKASEIAETCLKRGV